MAYFYAQIDSENTVVALSQLSGVIGESHPLYQTVIPIREYDESLIPTQTGTEVVAHKYTGKDNEGYGRFEEIIETIPINDSVDQSDVQSESEVGE